MSSGGDQGEEDHEQACGGQNVFREVFDERSEPSETELFEYAKKIGIALPEERHLLPIAREGLLAGLPEGWKPCFDETLDAWYYFNFTNGATQWQHALDSFFSERVETARLQAKNCASEVINAK